MGVLGKISGKAVVHFGALEMLITILLCYVIAVKEGHVKAWLPTISACGDHPPEEYIFRYGILTGGLLLVVLALYFYTADFAFSHNTTNVQLGVIAGLALGVVAVCPANKAPIPHTTSAVIFFVLEDILLLRITLQGMYTLSKLSIYIKATCSVIACLSTIGKFLVMMHYLPEVSSTFDIPFLPIFEWSNTLAILAYHWSFAFDFTDYYIAAWKSTSDAVSWPRKDAKSGVVNVEGDDVKLPLL